MSNVFHVNNSAPASITRIRPREKLSQAITFIIQKGTDPDNPEILVTEKNAQKAIYIPAKIPEIKVWEILPLAFLYQTSSALSVISAGVNASIKNI